MKKKFISLSILTLILLGNSSFAEESNKITIDYSESSNCNSSEIKVKVNK